MNNDRENYSIFNDHKQNRLREITVYSMLKRLLDIIGSITIFIVCIPIFIVIIIIYQFEKKKGSFLFKQDRVGLNGKLFKIYKFRSMAIDAEERLKLDKTLYNKYVKNNYKLEPNEDPRVTKFGSILRKTSLDELPQIINVLKGEMSLVGPRPVVEPELVEYGTKVQHFLSVKPGVTGYWQVSGRSNVVYPERVDLELYYVDNKSIVFDIKILFLTIINVILKKGAY